jgi:hypothetical protein
VKQYKGELSASQLTELDKLIAQSFSRLQSVRRSEELRRWNLGISLTLALYQSGVKEL